MRITPVVASLIRLPFHGALAAHVAIVRRVVAGTEWMERHEVLDRPATWLCGLLLAVLLWWLVRDAWG